MSEQGFDDSSPGKQKLCRIEAAELCGGTFGQPFIVPEYSSRRSVKFTIRKTALLIFIFCEIIQSRFCTENPLSHL